MTINVFPEWLPQLNLVLSVLAFVGIVALTVRRVFFSRNRPRRIRLLDYALLVSSTVLVAGALFQMHLMGLGEWMVIGSGGRALVLVIIVVLLITPDDLGGQAK